MGPYRGGQAEYLRVPWADFNLLELPPGDEHERGFTLLSDIFPTGNHGTELAGVEPGRTVAVFGAGPVGLMAAHSANIRGAAQTFVVDFQPDRLALAATMGATPVNLAATDAAEAIMDATDGFGVDCGVEAVGYQARDPAGHEHPGLVLDALVQVVRATGKIGVVGVYEPTDEGAATEDAKRGRYGSTTAPPSPRASPSGRASARSSVTTAGCATSSSAARPALASHLPRAAPGPGRLRLRAVRQARRRLDQGHPPPRQGRLTRPPPPVARGAAGFARQAAGFEGRSGWRLTGRTGPKRRRNMNGSVTAIWVIVAVAVVGLAVWLGSVALAARKPHQEHAHGGQLRGTAVQGGMHVSAGRSVAPRRDEPVTPGEVSGGDTLHPGTEDPAGTEPAGGKPGPGSPPDQ